MKKFLPAFFFLFLLSFFFLIPKADASCSLLRSKSPICAQDRFVDLTVSCNTDTFQVGTGKQYRIYVYKPGDSNTAVAQGLGRNYIDQLAQNRRELKFSDIPIKNAATSGSLPGKEIVGDWRVKICAIRSFLDTGIKYGTEALSCEQTIYESTRGFHVYPSCSDVAGVPSLVLPKGKTYRFGSQVGVKIKSAATNTPYTLWWYSARNYRSAVIATDGKQKFTDSQLPLEDGQPTVSFTIGAPPQGSGDAEIYDLCMTPNDPPLGSNFTFWLECEFRIKGVYFTINQTEVDNADDTPAISNESGIPQEDNTEDSLACDQYADPSTGLIIPADDPRILDPKFPKKCAPGAIGPCAEYVYPQMSIYPTNIWGKPIPANQKVAYKECKKINTAIGNISINPGDFVKSLFGVLLGISGGIAVLLVITSGYNLITSQGDPQKVQGARETLTSAIVGLLFIILSLVILEVIGVDILRIPGFGR